MNPVSLALASLVIAHPGGGPKLQARALAGHWAAVKIVAHTKQAAQEENNPAWYSIDLERDHQFEAMLGAPMEGKWTIKGSKILLNVRPIHQHTEGGGTSMTMNVTMDPIVLVASPDGKTLVRDFDGKTITFQRKPK